MSAQVPAKEAEAYPPPYAPECAPNQQGGFVQQPYPPAYAPGHGAAYPVAGQQQQQQTVVVAGGQVPVQNVVLVQRDYNPQVAGILPGFAFCMFPPGIIETGIRVSLAVMLLVLIAVGGATIDAEKEQVTDGTITVDATGWVGAAGWVIFVGAVTLITEFIMILLHFLNPSHFNNSYGIFGGLDIAKCVMAGIGLFIGCIVTGVETSIANDDLEDYCRDTFLEGSEACDTLERIYRLVLALTIINVVCMLLLLTLFVWDIIFLGSGFSSKIPVQRVSDQHR